MPLRRLSLALALLGASLALSCSSDEEPTDGEALACAPTGTQGVPLEPVCADALCAGGVSCSETIEVSGDLAAAASGAASGACLVLGPGSYGDATLPAGVSLLGRWADEVTVGAITLSGGTQTIRGVTATSILADGVEQLVVEQSRITGGDVGLAASSAGSVELACSEVQDSGDYGVLALDTAAVTVRRSYLHDLGGPGLWAACAAGCGCSGTASLDLVTVEEARHAGVHLGGLSSTLRNLSIVDTGQRPGLAGGVGLSATCGDIDAQDVTIDGAVEAGIFVSDMSGGIGAPGSEAGIIIINGKRGLWLSGSNALTLEGFTIQDSGGIGIGIDTGAQGIIIINGKVEDTAAAMLPVVGGGSQTVGDALLWMAGAQIDVTGVTLSGSARAAVLIDGEVAAGSSLTDVTLQNGDETLGIIQQGVMAGATAPAVANTPAVSQQPDAPFAIPEPPAALTSL